MREWAFVPVLVMAIASSVHAVNLIGCRDWTRLEGGQREETLMGLYEQILHSDRASRWQFNRVLTRQCLHGKTALIAAEFDEDCAQGIRTPLDSLEKRLWGHARSCVQ